MPARQTTTLPTIQHNVGDGNWDANRGPIHSIVLHTIVGTIASADAEFAKPGTQRSIQYAVGLDGSLHQWVDEDNVAYHAGDYIVNQTSIGIEHEDGGNYNGVRPDVLYETSAKLVADICKFYDIPCDNEHIFKHKDVIDRTIYPGGTGCPDALDTDRIIAQAHDILFPPVVPPAPIVVPPVPASVVEPVVVPVAPVLPTEPLPIVVTAPAPASVPVPDQTDTNKVTNTPDQTATTVPEANLPTSGQAGKVPFTVEMPISLQQQAKSIFPDWLRRLIFFVLSLIGIEEVKK